MANKLLAAADANANHTCANSRGSTSQSLEPVCRSDLSSSPADERIRSNRIGSVSSERASELINNQRTHLFRSVRRRCCCLLLRKPPPMTNWQSLQEEASDSHRLDSTRLAS